MTETEQTIDLSAAIDSILGQTFRDFELILLFDQSVCISEEVSKIRKDVRVRVEPRSHRIGSNSIFNVALKLAKGRYICIVNTNTISSPDRLGTQWNYMQRYPSIAAVGCLSKKVCSNGQMQKVFAKPIPYSVIKAYFLREDCLDPFSLMIRASALRNQKLSFDVANRYAGQYAFSVSLSKYWPIMGIGQPLVSTTAPSVNFAFEEYERKTAAVNKVRRSLVRQFNLPLTKAELNLHFKLMQNDYLEEWELHFAADWFNKLLDRNKQLKLYKSNVLFSLFQNILVMAGDKSRLGGWSIEKELVTFLIDRLPSGKLILEFGSGVGTDALLRRYNVISIEDDMDYAYTHAHNHTCLLSPVSNGWYSRNVVSDALSMNPDLLLIDGPRGTLREGILENLDLFQQISIPVIFDDMDRSIDYQIMRTFCKELDYSFTIETGAKKQYAYCVKSTI